MIHHVSVGTNDLPRSIAFYDAVLPGLRLRRTMDDPCEGMHYGTGHTEFSTIRTDAPATAGNGVHVAFDVEDRGMVDAFHAAALAAGGKRRRRAGAEARVRRALLRGVRPRSRRQQDRGADLLVEVRSVPPRSRGGGSAQR